MDGRYSVVEIILSSNYVIERLDDFCFCSWEPLSILRLLALYYDVIFRSLTLKYSYTQKTDHYIKKKYNKSKVFHIHITR